MAAVNGAGRGEWTETTVVAAIIETVVSIEGLGESRQLHTYRFIMMQEKLQTASDLVKL